MKAISTYSEFRERTEKVENWRNTTEWLENSGYKTELSVAEQIKNSIPVDILGKIANIRVEKDKITIARRCTQSQLPSSITRT